MERPVAAASELRHVGQQSAVLLRCQAQQPEENLLASYGIIQRPMIAQFNSKLVGDVLQRISPRTGQEHGGQIHGVVGRVDHRKAMRGQESQVELDVVPDNGMRAQELGEVAGDDWKGGRPLHLPGLDPCKSLYVVRDRAAGVNEGLEGVQHLVSPESHRSYFEDGVPFGIEAGCLEVQGNVDLIEGGNFQKAPPPKIGTGVVMVQSVDAAACHPVRFHRERFWRPRVAPVLVPPFRASSPSFRSVAPVPARKRV